MIPKNHISPYESTKAELHGDAHLSPTALTGMPGEESKKGHFRGFTQAGDHPSI